MGGSMPLLPSMPPMHHMPLMPAPPLAPPEPVSQFPPDNTPPSHTIYVSNLEEKVPEKELKTDLEAMFTQFGKILRIVAMNSLKRRGQAFIVFDTVESATSALNTMQGFPLYDKPMRIRFSKNMSDLIAKRQGTYVAREKKPLPPIVKPEKPQEVAVAAGPGAKPAAAKPRAPEVAPPHNILLLTGLPEGVTEAQLDWLFRQHHGFREVKMVPGRPDLAFVEYATEHLASEARRALNGHAITETHQLNVAFARK